MRSTLLLPRLASGLHQHPREAPKRFPVTFTDWSGRELKTHVADSEYPSIWIMPLFDAPAILDGLTEDESSLGMLVIKEADDKAARFNRLLARPGVKSVSINAEGIRIDWFARWLAKIAFGFAVICLGLPALRYSEVRAFVREGSSRYGYLVGGRNALQLPNQEYRLRREDADLFAISLTDMALRGRIWWVVKIRLFGRLQTPDYVVVLGPR